MYVVSLLFICILLLVGLKFISFLISESFTLSREELCAYECGFEHHNVSRVPFSMRYFFLTLLFLLFDLEIVFLMFVPFIHITSSLLSVSVMALFVTFLFFTLVYEWKDGTLEWLS